VRTAVGPVRITTEAARRVAVAGLGRVHSRFARTINVALDGWGDAGWLSVHEAGPGAPIPSPFGVACAALPDIDGPTGVRVSPEAIRLGGAPAISLVGAVRVETRVPTGTPMPSLAASAAALSAAPGGLGPVVAALLGVAARPAGPLAALALPALRDLEAATTRPGGEGSLAAAERLLGLGPGLTPAGDDVLLGWIAGLHAGGAGRLVGALGPRLIDVARARTSPLSVAFLAAALAGVVAEPVRSFVGCPDHGRLQTLLRLGATSGADLVGGYLLARHALRRGNPAPGDPLREI
jgi:hypothetical protein